MRKEEDAALVTVKTLRGTLRGQAQIKKFLEIASYRVIFLTGAPLNFLSKRSHVNWLGISLSARDCKGICT